MSILRYTNLLHSDGNVIMNHKNVRIWKDAVVAYLKLLSWYSLARTGIQVG